MKKQVRFGKRDMEKIMRASIGEGQEAYHSCIISALEAMKKNKVELHIDALIDYFEAMDKSFKERLCDGCDDTK